MSDFATASADPPRTYLERFCAKPGHLEQFEPLLAARLARETELGVETRQVYLETHAEPKITRIFQAPPVVVEQLPIDPELAELATATAPHVFRNRTCREVGVELITEPVAGAQRLAILRRYSITGDWDEFLSIWRRIVPVRAQYGFNPLFAVADRAHDMFTWAFDFGGVWADFPAAQRPYYRDPARVELRGVFDYLADYAITPAKQWLTS